MRQWAKEPPRWVAELQKGLQRRRLGWFEGSLLATQSLEAFAVPRIGATAARTAAVEALVLAHQSQPEGLRRCRELPNLVLAALSLSALCRREPWEQEASSLNCCCCQNCCCCYCYCCFHHFRAHQAAGTPLDELLGAQGQVVS